MKRLFYRIKAMLRSYREMVFAPNGIHLYVRPDGEIVEIDENDAEGQAMICS